LEKFAILKKNDALIQNAKLVLLDWSWHSEHGFAIVSGQVKNISEKPLHNIEAVAMFKTKAGKLVTSESSLIEFNPIMPRQASPFEVVSTYNPQMETVNITFKNLLGGTILWRSDSDGLEFLPSMECINSILRRLQI
ncbi:unnamed protein product, partial [marine sediment metagenome]